MKTGTAYLNGSKILKYIWETGHGQSDGQAYSACISDHADAHARSAVNKPLKGMPESRHYQKKRPDQDIANRKFRGGGGGGGGCYVGGKEGKGVSEGASRKGSLKRWTSKRHPPKKTTLRKIHRATWP